MVDIAFICHKALLRKILELSDCGRFLNLNKYLLNFNKFEIILKKFYHLWGFEICKCSYKCVCVDVDD